jgi:hypothetical protein
MSSIPPEASGLKARLDKTGRWALCGLPVCSYRLAPVVVEDAPVGAEVRPIRTLRFDPGWQPRRSDGGWTLTRHAAARVRRGQRPAFRRDPRRPARPAEAPPAARAQTLEVPVPAGVKNLAKWQSITARLGLEPGEPAEPRRFLGRQVIDFPAHVQCPKCGWWQVLDADALRVRPPRGDGLAVALLRRVKSPQEPLDSEDFPQPGGLLALHDGA